ncbi:MAG: antibiotic biosynthesis monooxygenase [Acidimicrobiaceae bacterium]|nr:antibiotic biosynthesis monooxygenase [Acidimicrobiaceae bacterium]
MTIVTVFRSRLRPGIEGEYEKVASELSAIVREMDGFLDERFFSSDNGERVTIVRFADRRSHQAWAKQPEHVRAQDRGRSEFYAWYDITVAEETHHHWFESPSE